MRWEDQEINYASPEGKFIEVFHAKFGLLAHAGRSKNHYIPVNQTSFDKWVDDGVISDKAKGARIDRICLQFRLSCGLSPGGGNHPELGAMHFSSDSDSRYAIAYVSPKNDWINIMVVSAERPEQKS